MVQLPPQGTRGAETTRLLKALPDPGNLMFRMGFKIMGLTLVRTDREIPIFRLSMNQG